MKKYKVLFVLPFLILMGCDKLPKESTTKTDTETTTETSPANGTTTTTDSTLSLEDATEIALSDAKVVSKNELQDFKVEYDTSYGERIVKVKFKYQGVDYKYKIAMNGEIRKVEHDGDDDHYVNTGDSVLSMQEIKDQLLKKYPEAYDFELELDEDNHMLVWEVEFEDHLYEYEGLLDAYTGETLEWDQDRK